MQKNMQKKDIINLLKLTSKQKNSLLKLKDKEIKNVLKELSQEILRQSEKILIENNKDLKAFKDKFSTQHPNYDRLSLNESRIQSMCNEINCVVNSDFSVDNNIISEQKINDLNIQKISVPFGVVSVIYEARPNVTVDVFILCFRSQNCCILKGGEEASNTNKILIQIIKEVLKKNNLSENIINLLTLNRADSKNIKYFLAQNKLIDICIPRGGKGLIEFVKKYSKIPVITTGAGVVHLYLDEEFEQEVAANIIINSKTRRVSVCNALDCLLVHKKSLSKIHSIVDKLIKNKVTLFCDNLSYKAIGCNIGNNIDYNNELIQPITKEEIGKEFLDYKISIITVSGVKQALKYISKYGSSHSDGIISSIKKNQNYFVKNVDSAVAYINTSTAFTDGAQFGLGSEIGISTQKLHIRGPMGVESLRTSKYVVLSDGKIRN